MYPSASLWFLPPGSETSFTCSDLPHQAAWLFPTTSFDTQIFCEDFSISLVSVHYPKSLTIHAEESSSAFSINVESFLTSDINCLLPELS